jgi:hypothetical protein
VTAANVLPGDGAPDTGRNGSGSLLMTGAGDISDPVRMHEWRLPIEGGCRWGDAVVVAAAWISVIGSAVTAIAAFGGCFWHSAPRGCATLRDASGNAAPESTKT